MIADIDETLLQDLTGHIEKLEEDQRDRDRAFTQERDSLRGEIRGLQEALMEASSSVEQAQQRNKALERDNDQCVITKRFHDESSFFRD